ncbi:MAG: hypothetical protein ABIO76_08870 [Ginsengibacter sp.]
MKEKDALFYALPGDRLAENLLPAETVDWKDKELADFEAYQLEEKADRLFTNCWMILTYCHGSSFNEEPYIQTCWQNLACR